MKSKVLRNGFAFILTAALFVGGGLPGGRIRAEAETPADTSYWKRYSSDYFYLQLTDDEKAFYDKLYISLDKLLNSDEDVTRYITNSDGSKTYYSEMITIGSNLSNERAYAIAQLFTYDEPQFYFVSNGFMTTSHEDEDGNITYYSAGFPIYEDFADGQKRAEATAAFRKKLDELTSQIDQESTVQNKQKKAYNIVQEICSSGGKKYDASSYGALMYGSNSTANCAEAYSMLANYAGADTINVTSKRNTQWSISKPVNNWYNVDAAQTGGYYGYCYGLTDEELLGVFGDYRKADFWSALPVPVCDTAFEEDNHVHSFVTTEVEPTCNLMGYTLNTCTGCSYSYRSNLTYPVPHEMTKTEAHAGCLENGNSAYWHCSRCNKYFSDENGKTEIEEGSWVTPPAGHNWGGWYVRREASCTQDGLEFRYCLRCRAREDHILPALGHDYTSKAVDPTCAEEGYTLFTCSRCGYEYKDEYSPALGHLWGEWTNLSSPTCTGSGEQIHTCSRCGDTEKEVIPALGHDWSDWTVVVEPSCTETGEKERTCARCKETEYLVTDALGHDLISSKTEPTCVEEGYTTHSCSRCSYSYRDSFTDALGHAWDVGHVITEPTCTEEGQGSRTCVRCNAEEKYPIAELGHDLKTEVIEPTCKEEGYTRHTCRRCEYSFQDEIKPALGHDWSEWKETVPAACLETGIEERTCHRCQEKETRITAALGHAWGEWSVTTEPTYTETGIETRTCSRCNTAEIREIPVKAGFTDMQNPSHPFYKAIYWAADQGITSGYTDGRFGANDNCTRGQVVTFLWRAAGKPEPSPTATANFKDMPKSTSPFYKAILWAAEQGITSGYADGRFGVNDTCTRGQIVTFLWRFAGKPTPNGTKTVPDLPAPGSPFYTPILWAVNDGITAGMADGKFHSEVTCTRGQIVTFLYRYMVK